jgi:iron complex transport system substrate-binding protein
VGQFLGEPARGDALATSLDQRLKQIGDQTKQASGSAPVVACLESLQPLILAGDWIPELIRLSGGTPAHVGEGSQASWMDWDALLALDPDVIVSMTFGYRLPRSIRETLNAAQRPEWKRLKAVRQNQVYVVDSSGYFSRPGPRLLDSLEILAEILSPEQFPPRNRDNRWVRFETETLP